MGRKRDQFWYYAENLKGRFKCNYCKHEFPGGASRIKSHLAGVKGRDVVICDVVPEDVQKKAYEATQGTNKKHKNASTSSNDKESTITSASISTIQKEKIVTQSKEEDMAEIVPNNLMDRLVTNAFSLTTKDIIFKWGFQEELKNLFDTLYKIKVVLHQKRQLSGESERIWSRKLQKVAYEVDNVLDEFDYKIIQQKVQLQNQMIEPSFLLCNHDKVKTIKQSLDTLLNDVVGFGLRMELLKSIIKIRLAKNDDSFLNVSEVFGREFEVVTIVKKLISSSNQQVISVLPIVGMAGHGKTTLAKVLYNHEEIKKHFDVLEWVHVSENFEVEEISRKICKSLKRDLTNLERKKYFLVLDDIWIKDHNKLDLLRSRLEEVFSCTRITIIVTTSSNKVAQIMGTLPSHYLKKLSEADCWSILKKRVFADEGKSLTFDLEDSGREIAIRCRGVPWVARVLGEAMCIKCDNNEWLAIQNDKIWDLLDDNSDIFLALKLWFDNLPIPSLKQCFTYCAILPKDYDMKKDEVIQYWMAEGFLEPAKEGNMAMEDIGNMYFNILLATSFFQNARNDAYGNIISCKMHDVVHDFALSISKSETLILERDSMDDISNIQRLFVPYDGRTTLGTSFSGDGFIKLRTLILENFDFDDMLSNFKCLRVLKLTVHCKMELFDSIEQLMHLRLLHISFDIEELPQSITKLYNLQTLRIEEGEFKKKKRIEEGLTLKKLPEDLSNLFNLRHIHINHIGDYCCIMQTPKNMGRLTNLQTLPFFVVGPDEGYRITELGPLMNLRGEINIKNLDRVEEEEEAKGAKLKEKEIFKLGLYWPYPIEAGSSEKEEKVLEGLQPHPNLKSLTIHGYRGKKFPSWVGLSSLYHNLIEIRLMWCLECEDANLIPTLGHLPCLRVLEITGMGNLRCIRSKFSGSSDGSYRNTTTLFPALRILKLQCMRSLKEWKEAVDVSVFPCLEEFTIRRCPELSYLLEATLHTGISLQKLVVDNCGELKNLPGVPFIIFGELTNVQGYILPVEYLENEDWLHPTFSIQRSLQKLKLRESPHIFLDHIQYLTALKILWIEGFHEIEALTEWLGNLSSLQKLYIVDCENLVHLPSEKVMRRLTQLKTLIIQKCPKFEDNERSKSSHIPFVDIQDDRDLSKLEF